jgi:integrase
VSRHRADVSIRSIQTRDKDGRAKQFVVRWAIDGKEFSKGFTHKQLARDYEADLNKASRDSTERWNIKTGEPYSWKAISEIDVATFCRSYIAREWDTYEPSSAASLIETLSRLVEAASIDRAQPFDPEWRPNLRAWLRPNNGTPLTPALSQWIKNYSIDLDDLDGAILLRIDEALRRGVDGQVLGQRTQIRRVGVARRCLERAVAEKLISELQWPKPDKGQQRRKANAAPKELDQVPAPHEIPLILDAIYSARQAESTLMYRAMTAVGFYAGLRPGETIALTTDDVTLPETGWGEISVTKAWVGVKEEGDDPVGQTKTTNHRKVPIPSQLVAELRGWLTAAEIVAGPLFRTRTGKRPTQSNWGRVLRRACSQAGTTPVTSYGLRHTCASYMSAAGVPIAEAAARLGHSTETMLRYYVDRVAGHVDVANKQIEDFLG